MTLPVVIPNEFANATASIPLSQLDSNFNTLANVVNEINAGTQQLSNANVVTLIVTGNATIGDASSDTVTLNSTLTANTAVIFSAGTSAAPAIVPTGDTNTGIFFPASDTIAFAEGGAEAMRIDSSGRVGIGTTSPATLLNVSSATTNAARLRVTGTGSTGGNYRGYEFGSSGGFSGGIFQDESTSALSFWSSSGGASVTITSSGNVGIGTSSPADNLAVYDSGTDSRIYIQSSSTGAAGTDGFMLGSLSGEAYVYNYENQPLVFGTNATERARITSGGYFKASNTGSYRGSTADYHEFVNNSNSQPGVNAYATGASIGSTACIQGVAVRSANSAFSLLDLYSGDSADREFQLRGDGNAYADGSWNGSGADYAEYFESATGEAIPRGTTVVLENNKVRAATADDPASSIIGVVRPKEFGKGSMVVGNLAWNMWTDKYITDDFGVYEMEDHEVVEWEETITDEEGNTSTKPHSYESHAIPEGVTVPADATRKTHDENGKKFQHRKLNPNWSAEVQYTPREERPEWLIIGLLGQVPVLKGQPVGDRWVKMRDISETVEEWFIR